MVRTPTLGLAAPLDADSPLSHPVDEPQQQRQRRPGVVGVLAVGARGGHQFVDGGGGETADAEVVELAVGRDHRDVGLALPQAERREQPRVLVQAGIQGGLVGHGQRSGERQPNDGALLVGHQVEVDVEVGDVAAAVHRMVQRHEPPAAHPARVDTRRPARVGLVDVDHQHMSGVGFDVVVVGDLGRAGVPDAARRADLHARVLVAQRHIVHRAAGDRRFHRRELDQGRPVLVGNEDVDGAVADDDAGGPVGGQAVDHFGDEVGGGRLRRPRCGHDLQTGAHLVHARPVENRDVVGAFGREQRAGVHRRRVERIVVARQQVDRNADGPHRLQRLTDDSRRQLVVLEHVAGHHDELGAGLFGQRPQPRDHFAAGGRIPRLRLAVEEVSGHPELPVGGVHESHLDPPSLPRLC